MKRGASVKRITAGYGADSYQISIGPGAARHAGKIARGLGIDAACVVTDSNTGRFLPPVPKSLSGSGVAASSVEFPAGERSKTPETVARLCSEFARRGLTRSGAVIALGGGVVGDAAGFAAACYMRGVRHIQMPTTLMAMTDSSVGGKTAVDLPEGKNLMGAFWPPAAVLADTNALASLPEREVKAGLAEVVKYYALGAAEIGRALKKNRAAGETDSEWLMSLDWDEIVLACCRKKAGVAAGDPRDNGARRHLNFGHTFAHALEKYRDYGSINHGEAVAAGMRLALETGERLGVTPASVREDIISLMDFLGLDAVPSVPVGELLPIMLGDKKNNPGSLNLVLLRGAGCPEIFPISPDRLADVWR
jgi:3-dehydroquinate synthase